MRKSLYSLRLVYAAACRLAQAGVVFWLLPPIMALLVVGTIAQRTLGLYAAHKIFFSSFYFWAGPMPLPGGYLLTGFLTLALACKFLFQSEWNLQKSGIILTHLGVLVLLGGGFLTALFAQEGYMAIQEGQQTPYVYDYTSRELVIFMPGGKHRNVAFNALKTGETLVFENIPFALHVKNKCVNCNILKREDSPENYGSLKTRNMARFMALDRKPEEKDPEMNLSGVTFEISQAGPEQDGIYIAFEGMPRPIEIKYKNKIYTLIFGKAQRRLPFSIRLEDFRKETYPGLDMPKAFTSDVTVIDGALEWPARIEMNKPLRYKGYTLYQSSFEETEEGAVSVLSVVENRGRLFPYIGTALIALGLLLHIAIMAKKTKTT